MHTAYALVLDKRPSALSRATRALLFLPPSGHSNPPSPIYKTRTNPPGGRIVFRRQWRPSAIDPPATYPNRTRPGSRRPFHPSLSRAPIKFIYKTIAETTARVDPASEQLILAAVAVRMGGRKKHGASDSHRSSRNLTFPLGKGIIPRGP